MKLCLQSCVQKSLLKLRFIARIINLNSGTSLTYILHVFRFLHRNFILDEFSFKFLFCDLSSRNYFQKRRIFLATLIKTSHQLKQLTEVSASKVQVFLMKFVSKGRKIRTSLPCSLTKRYVSDSGCSSLPVPSNLESDEMKSEMHGLAAKTALKWRPQKSLLSVASFRS